MAHFLSCFTAQDLGPDFVRHGCRAYFGYADEFAWNGQTNPAPYLWCDAEIDRALADGETAEGALNRALKKFNQSINTLGLVRGKTAAAGMRRKHTPGLNSVVARKSVPVMVGISTGKDRWGISNGIERM